MFKSVSKISEILCQVQLLIQKFCPSAILVRVSVQVSVKMQVMMFSISMQCSNVQNASKFSAMFENVFNLLNDAMCKCGSVKFAKYNG